MAGKSKNILVTGASGYVGPYVISELVKKQKEIFDVNIFAVYNTQRVAPDGITPLKCDISRSGDVEKLFTEICPTTVMHLASGTPTRISGKPDDYIKKINIGATEHIAKLCASNGALMIFTSSDLVYEAGLNLDENNAALNPLTLYAQTKLEAEQAIKEYAKKYLIFRTALVYGFSRTSYRSFFDDTYSSLKEGRPVKAFTDQYRNAIYIEDAAKIVSEAAFRYEKNDTVNLGGYEYLSRYDMCLLMAQMYGLSGNLIIPASADDFKSYQMVKQINLNISKLKELGFETRPFRENLIRAMNYMPAGVSSTA